jgi:hypothetical protein
MFKTLMRREFLGQKDVGLWKYEVAVPVEWYLHVLFKKCQLRNYCGRISFWERNTRTVWKVRGLVLLLRVGSLWRCGDGLFFEVPPLESDALLTTLHPLLKNALQIVCRKLQEDSGTGGFDLWAPFSWLKKPRKIMRRDLDCMADFLMGFHRSRWARSLPLFNSATLTLN